MSLLLAVHKKLGKPPYRVVQSECVKMCNIDDFKLEYRELEEMLLKHFQKWKSHVCQCLDEEEMKRLDWIDEFSKDVRKDLLKLKHQGKLVDC